MDNSCAYNIGGGGNLNFSRFRMHREPRDTRQGYNIGGYNGGVGRLNHSRFHNYQERHVTRQGYNNHISNGIPGSRRITAYVPYNPEISQFAMDAWLQEEVVIMDGTFVSTSELLTTTSMQEGVVIMDGTSVRTSQLLTSTSMQENLELEEPTGRVGSRLSEDRKTVYLKTRKHSAATTSINEEPDICVICQAEYEEGEKIGSLNCRHEYHAQCIKKWLLQSNSCPICKAAAAS